MRTYGCGVDPADLRFKLRETHEQNHVEIPPVAREVCYNRNAGDVGFDKTQRLELVFWALSAFYEIPEGGKHPTWFYIPPLRGGQIPCVFGDSRAGLLWWGTLGSTAEGKSYLSIL
jgi:hypothetical protein